MSGYGDLMFFLRRMNHMKQTELADKIGCHSVYISQIEKGKRTGSKAFWNDVCKVFGLTRTNFLKLIAIFQNVPSKQVHAHAISAVLKKFG
jgi:DNA-binding XRE family transcriptional regulator